MSQPSVIGEILAGLVLGSILPRMACASWYAQLFPASSLPDKATSLEPFIRFSSKAVIYTVISPARRREHPLSNSTADCSNNGMWQR